MDYMFDWLSHSAIQLHSYNGHMLSSNVLAEQEFAVLSKKKSMLDNAVVWQPWQSLPLCEHNQACPKNPNQTNVFFLSDTLLDSDFFP